MKKVILGVVALTAIGAATLYAARESITFKLVDRVINQRMQDPLQSLPDGLHVGLCGTGSPMPDPSRSAPCTIVIAGKQMYLFDSGTGAGKQISRMEFSVGQLKGIFLTHFHSDHIDGLGEVMMTRWAASSDNSRLALYGPQGLKTVAEGFAKAYELDSSYRVAHHGAQFMNPKNSGADVNEFDISQQEYVTVLKDGDLQVDAFRVDHQPIDAAVGYKVRYKGRTVVISGDTKKSANMEKYARGADLLIHEALSPELVRRLENIATNNGRTKLSKIFKDIPDYHTTPEQVAEVAQQAEVKAVVLSHIVPPLPLAPMKEIFLGSSRKIFPREFRIGEDGDFITLPVNSTAIEFNRRYTR